MFVSRTTAQLAELDSEWSEALLLEGLQAYGNGLPRALEIDVLEAARTRDTDALYEAVEAIEANWDAEDPLDGWRGCMDGGDADRGRTIFISHWAAQCQRCHAIGGDGGEAGPNLQDVGGRMSPRSCWSPSSTRKAKWPKGTVRCHRCRK